jgi:UDPglucose 6-dehydrogenase
MRNITVIGVGYVGLVTGVCFSDLGNRVVCVDINEQKVEALKQGSMPIYEPGLEELVARNVRAGRLAFTTSYAEGLRDAEFVFIAVGTPEGVDGEADLRYVRMAARSIAEVMDHPMIIVNKSTVPVGTGDWVSRVPARGCCHRGLYVSRPSCVRLVGSGGCGESSPVVPPAAHDDYDH